MAEQNKRIQFLQDALRKLAKAVREVSGGLIDLDKTSPNTCLLYTSPSPRDGLLSRMPSSA